MKLFERFSYFLVPSIFQGALSVGMLPVTTYILDPEDYGVFALLTSVTTLISMVATSGAAFLLYAHFPTLSRQERQQLISSILIFGLTLSGMLAIVVYNLWPWIAHMWEALAVVPPQAIILSLIAMLLSVPWTIAYLIIILEGNSRPFALVTICSSVASALCVTVALYVFELGVLSLFLAAVASSLALFIGGLTVLKPHLRLVVTKEWVGKLVRLGLFAAPSSLFEMLQNIVERALLTLHVGFFQLGIYTHAQQYRNLTFMPVKAVSNTIWPTTLAESREVSSQFPRTGEVWNFAYVSITIVGTLFATLGKYLVAGLTHGKFTEASTYVALLMIFLLIQYSGKPQSGVLYAYGQGEFLSKMMIVASGTSIVLMFVFIPLIGIFGALLGLFGQQLLLRIGNHIRARRYRHTPFQDQWVLIGAGLIAFAVIISKLLSLEITGSLLLFSALVLWLSYSARQMIVTTVCQISKTLRAIT
jgi:O-antigen/teichoic acid export membrane protein